MKGLKILSVALLALIALTVGALALVDPNQFKDQIARLLTDTTGLHLEIQGDINYSIWKPHQLQIGGIVVSNDQAPVLQWDSAQVDIALIPLLRRSLVIERAYLGKPRINLVPRVLEMLGRQPSSTGPANEPRAEQPSLLSSIMVHSFEVSDLEIRYQLDEHPVVVEDLDLSMTDLVLIQDHQFDLHKLKGVLTLAAQGISHHHAQLEKLTLKGRIQAGLVVVEHLSLDGPRLKTRELLGRLTGDAPSRPGKAMPQSGDKTPEKTQSAARLPITSVIVQEALVNGLSFADAFQGKSIEIDDLNLTLNNVRVIHDRRFDLHNLRGHLQLAVAGARYQDSRLGALRLRGRLNEANLEITQANLDGGEIVLDQLLADLTPPAAPAAPGTSARILPIAAVSIRQASANRVMLRHQLGGNPVVIDAVDLKLKDARLITGHQMDFSQLRGQFQLGAEGAVYQDSHVGSLTLHGQFANSTLVVEKMDMQDPSIALHQLLGTASPAQGTRSPGPTKTILADVLPLAAVRIEQLNMDRLSLEHRISPEPVEISRLNLRARGLDLVRGGNLDLGKISGEIKATARRLRYPPYQLDQVAMESRIGKGRFSVDTLVAGIFDGKIDLNGSLDLIPRPLTVKLDLRLNRLNLAKASHALQLDTPVGGKLDGDARLSTRLGERPVLISSLNGEGKLHGTQLTISKLDADKLISTMVKTNKMTTTDMAGLMMLGPLGILASKTVALGTGLPGMGSGTTRIREMLSQFMIKDGVFEAIDVATATHAHRGAVKGAVDLNTLKFVDFRFAIVDDDGCALIEERIRGTLAKPEIGLAGVAAGTAIGTVVDPVLGVIKQTGKMIGAQTCTPFYQGKVAHPQ